ncbi:MAG: ribosome biogenesis factor YjgA [Burkholderiaceae bacterium]
MPPRHASSRRHGVGDGDSASRAADDGGPADLAPERPSKSQRKRDMHSLQALGEELVALPPHRLASVPLAERLREAVEMAQRIKSREGRRRQLQFVGKLMRDVDPQPIRHALDLLSGDSRAATALMHQAEHWRTRLLDEPEAIAEWLRDHPQTERAALAGLIDAARAEMAQGQAGRRYRELFRLLRDALSPSPSLSPSPGATDLPSSTVPDLPSPTS